VKERVSRSSKIDNPGTDAVSARVAAPVDLHPDQVLLPERTSS